LSTWVVAGREGRKALKDAHGAWLHGWIVEMEDTGKLERLKVEDPIPNPSCSVSGINRRWQITMGDLRQDQIVKKSDEGRSFA
jgi:hypothetical protein